MSMASHGLRQYGIGPSIKRRQCPEMAESCRNQNANFLPWNVSFRRESGRPWSQVRTGRKRPKADVRYQRRILYANGSIPHVSHFYTHTNHTLTPPTDSHFSYSRFAKSLILPTQQVGVALARGLKGDGCENESDPQRSQVMTTQRTSTRDLPERAGCVIESVIAKSAAAAVVLAAALSASCSSTQAFLIGEVLTAVKYDPHNTVTYQVYDVVRTASEIRHAAKPQPYREDAASPSGTKWTQRPIADFQTIAGKWQGSGGTAQGKEFDLEITYRGDGSYTFRADAGVTRTARAMRIEAGVLKGRSYTTGDPVTVTLFEDERGNRMLKGRRTDGLTWTVRETNIMANQ